MQVPVCDDGNLEFALAALIEARGRSAENAGIADGQKHSIALSLSDLLNERHLPPGPLEYETVDVAPGGSSAVALGADPLEGAAPLELVAQSHEVRCA